MRVDILTLFPPMFEGPLTESILSRARQRGLLNLKVHDIRDYTRDKHRQADDSSYGGGPGMVMKPEPIYGAIENIIQEQEAISPTESRIILMCPSGEKLSQKKAIELSASDHLIIICGHYEGIDERVRENLVTDEISIGDYVLTGGELPAMVLVDTVARLIPGVVGDDESIIHESFYEGLLDFPHYTRPEEFKGEKVPKVLISGNHEEVGKWRRKESLKRTLYRRPDLLAKAKMTDEDKRLLEEIICEKGAKEKK